MLSNNFSLAEMIDPIWAGCVAASDDGWKAWLAEREIVELRLVEPGARLLHRPAGRDRPATPELVRVWYSEANFARRDRAVELAERLGVQPDPRRARLRAWRSRSRWCR